MNRLKRILFFFLVLILRGVAVAQLSGTYNVPSNYPSLASAITALNTLGVSGPVLITVNAGFTETAPVGGYTLTASGTAANSITFQKTGAGANPLITAYAGGVRTPGTAIQDGIWSVVGSDYVTIDGIDLLDPNAGNPATMEYGYGFFKASATDGCQNNVIRNCVITLNRINNATGTAPAVDGSRGINVVNSLYSTQTTVLTVTSAFGSHSNNGFYNNVIQNCNIGIALIGYAAASPFTFADTNNDIGGNSALTGNSILNFGGAAAAANPAAAVRTLAQYNINVSYNTINNNNGSGLNHPSTLRGIYLNTAQSANASVSGNTVTINGGGTTTQVSVIENLSGATAANNTVSINYNLIQNNTNASNTTGTFYNIINNGASAAYLNVSNNTFSNCITNASSGSTYFIYNTGAIANEINFNNNLISACSHSASTSGTCYYLFNNAASSASLNANSNVFTGNSNSTATGNIHLIYNAIALSGDISYTNNLVSNYSCTATGGAFYGLYNNGASLGNVNISTNTISNAMWNSATATKYLIYNNGAVSNSLNLNSNLMTGCNSTVSTSGSFYGVYNTGNTSYLSISGNSLMASQTQASNGSVFLINNSGAAPVQIDLLNNAVTTWTNTIITNGGFYGIYNFGTSSAIFNLQNTSITANSIFGATGTSAFLYNTGAIANSINSLNLSNNVISGNTTSVNSSGGFYGIYNNAASALNLNLTNNSFSNNISVSANGPTHLIYNSGATTNTFNTVSISNNQVSAHTFSSSSNGPFYLLFNNAVSTGSLSVSNNSIVNCTWNTTASTRYLINNTGSVSVSGMHFINNTFSNLTHTTNTTGQFFGISNTAISGSDLEVTGNTFNTISNAASTGFTYLLYNSAAITGVRSFTNNLFSSFQHTSSGSADLYGIYNFGSTSSLIDLSANTFTNCNITTASGSAYLIHNTGPVATSIGTVQINNNFISGITNSISSTGSFFGVYNNGVSAANLGYSNNTFTNCTSTSASGATHVLYNRGAITNTFNTVNFTNNSIGAYSFSSTSNGPLYLIYNSGVTTSSTAVLGNSISNIALTASTSSKYFVYNTGVSSGSISIGNNTCSFITHSLNTTGLFYFINNGATATGSLSVSNNLISDCQLNATTGDSYLVHNSGAVGSVIQLNSLSVSNLTTSSNGAGVFYGIYNNAASTASLFLSNNTFSNCSRTSSTGATFNIYNRGAVTTTFNSIFISNNKITNQNYTANGNGAYYQIYNNGVRSGDLTIDFNTVSNSNWSSLTADRYLIINSGVVDNNANILNNTLVNITSTLNSSGGFYGIYNAPVATSSAVLNMNGNVISNQRHSASTGVVQFLSNTGNMVNGINFTSNTISDYTVNTSSSGNLLHIYNAGPSAALLSIQSNSILNATSNNSAGSDFVIYNTAAITNSIVIANNSISNLNTSFIGSGAFYAIYNNAANTSSLSVNANSLSSLQNTATNGAVHYIYNRGTVTNTFNVINLGNNWITNNTVNAGAFVNQNYAIFNSGVTATNLAVSSNTISNINWLTTGSGRYLIFNSGAITNSVSISGNVLSGHSNTVNTSGSLYGIYNAGPASGNLEILSNQLNALNSVASSGNTYLLYNAGIISNSVSILSNTLLNCSHTATTNGTFTGILNTGSNSQSLKIDANVLTNNLASSATGSTALIFSTGAANTTVNAIAIINNVISGFTHSSTSTGPFYGIYHASVSGNSISINSNAINTHVSSSALSNRFLIYNTGTVTSQLSLSSNTLSNGTYTGNTTGTIYGIINSAATPGALLMDANVINTLSLAATSGINYAIFNNGAVSGTSSISNNSLSNVQFNASTSGTYYGIYNLSSNSSSLSISSNTFSNQSIHTKSVSTYVILNTGVVTSTVNAIFIDNNLIASSSHSIDTLAAFYGVYNNVVSAQNISLSGNRFLNHSLNVKQSARYLIYNTSPSGNAILMNNNRFDGNTYSDSLSPVLYALHNAGNFASNLQMSANTFSANLFSSKNATLFLIHNSGGASTPLNAVAMNANTIAANTSSIGLNNPFYGIYQKGTGITDLNLNGNMITGNVLTHASAASYLLYNSAAVNGSLSMNSNLIANNSNSTSSTADYFGLYSGGVTSSYVSISTNTFSGNSSAITSGATHLIYNYSASAVVIMNNNALSYAFTNATSPYIGLFNSIYNAAGTTSTQLDVNGNTFTNYQFANLSGLSPIYYIRNTNNNATLNFLNNSWLNLSVKNAAAHYLMYNPSSTQSLVNVSNNSVTGYTRVASGSADLYVYYSDGNTVPATCVQTYSANTVSNISSAIGGVGAFYGIYSVDGGISPYPKKLIFNNSISNVNYNSSGDFIGFYANFLGDGTSANGSSVFSNTISSVTWPGNIFGIYHGMSNSPLQTINIYNNLIHDISSSGSSSSIYPACLNAGGAGSQCYKNKIYNISSTGSNSKSHGIYVTDASNTQIYNNRIGQILAPNSVALHPINGIYIAAGSTVNVFYNTVYLNAVSSAPNFNSNAIFASIVPQLTLRNNIFINTSVATGTGITAAYRRSSASLSSFANASDRNIYYAGTPGSANLIYCDPTNTIQTLQAYQALMSPRETNAKKENTPFTSTLGANNSFLMIDPTLPSFSESGANNLLGISDDFDAQIRQGNVGYAGTGTAPDIGSDEFNQILTPCNSANAGTLSPLTLSICAGQNITLNSSGFTYSAAGGITHQWQVSSSATGPYSVALGTGVTNAAEFSSSALSTGTLYYVLTTTCSITSQTAISNQATVVVRPVPSVSLSVNSSTLCSGQSLNFNGTSDIGTSYLWSGPNNYTSTAQNPVILNAMTYAGGTYSLLVSTASCSNTANISTTVYPTPPSFSIQPASAVICAGGSQSISASVSALTPVLNFTSQINQNSPTGYPAPYSAYYGGQRMQMLIQAAELTQAGFVAGSPITSIQFPVVSFGASWGTVISSCQNFQINIGHTPLTSLLSFQNGLTNVLAAYNFTPIVGYSNTHTFSAPFVWDGINNILLETTFSNNMIGNAATSVIQYNSPTGYQSTVVYRADNQSAAQIAAATASNINVGATRPNFKLNGISVGNYTWTPPLGLSSTTTQSTVASPLSSIVYSAMLSNGNCSSQNTLGINVQQTPTVSALASSTILCVGNVATLTASGANTYSWSTSSTNSLIQVSPAGNTSYIVTGINFPCPTSSAVINMSVVPAIIISAGSASPVICAGQTTTLYANGANSYTWTNGANTASTVVSPSVSTSYTVVGSNGPGCFAQQALSIVSNSVPLLICAPMSQTLCAGKSFSFSASGAISYTWLPANLSSANLVVIPNATSTYTLIGQAPNTCKSTLLVNAVVDPCTSLQHLPAQLQGISVYPNPTQGRLLLEFNFEGNKQIQLYDVTGAKVLEIHSENDSENLNLSAFAKGVYLLMIQSNGASGNYRIILN